MGGGQESPPSVGELRGGEYGASRSRAGSEGGLLGGREGRGVAPFQGSGVMLWIAWGVASGWYGVAPLARRKAG